MKPMPRNFRRSLLASIAVAIWAVVAVLAFQVKEMAAKAPMAVTLKSDPKNVWIVVDNREVFGRTFQTTPIKIPLAPGKHRIKISRPGYITHEISVEGSSGQTIPIDNVLERQSSIAMGAITIDDRELDNPATFDIDDGLVVGETPQTIDDLIVETDHLLTVTYDEHKYSCKFKLQANARSPLNLAISVRNSGRIRIENCRGQRLRKRRK